MDFLAAVMAVFGIAAVLWRLLRASLRGLKRGVEGFLVGEVADTHARRGDLTRLQEAEELKRRARLTRWRAFAEIFFWIVLLIAPSLTPWPRTLYAAYALLWLVPRRRRQQVQRV